MSHLIITSNTMIMTATTIIVASAPAVTGILDEPAFKLKWYLYNYYLVLILSEHWDIDFTQLPEESDKVYVGDDKDDGIVDGLKIEDISITIEIIIIQYR